MGTVSIYDYSDFRKFLEDWQALEQSRDSSMNKSEISRRLGLPRTRSYFTDVLGGKKVTATFLDRFASILNLTKDETGFFRALVAFNQASSPEERETTFDTLVSLDRSPRSQLPKEQFAYYRHWWVGAVRAVLSIKDHAEDWTRLAKEIRPAITPVQAKNAVEFLVATELVERVDGYWKPKVNALTSGDAIQDEVVLQLQLQQFQLARSAIMTDFGCEKDVTTNTLSVSATGLASILRKIASFRSEILSIVHKDEHSPDRVYQLCLAFFPLSRSTP